MKLHRVTFLRAGAIAALSVAWCGLAGAATFDIVLVQIERGFENADGSGTIAGQLSAQTQIAYPLTSSSAQYSRVDDPATGGFYNEGSWSVSGGGLNSLSGDFTTRGRTFALALGRSTGERTITGGSGLFAQATGHGTFEAFSREIYDPSWNNGPAYAQIVISRLRVDAPNAPAPSETRPVSVSSRVGFNDFTAGRGGNTGALTSDSFPIMLKNVRSEYPLNTFPTIGESFGTDYAGNTLSWQFTTTESAWYDDVFYRSAGTATLLAGTGMFDGYSGNSQWEAFEVGLGQTGANMWAYSTVIVDRYTLQAPIPEPQTYALMAAGLVLMGGVVLRRRTAQRS